MDAAAKGTSANAGDTRRNGIAAAQAAGILQERSLVLIEQNAVCAAEKLICRIHRDCGQAAAVIKGKRTDVRNTATDGDVGQAIGAIKRLTADIGDTIGDYDFVEHLAGKGIHPNALDRKTIGRAGNGHQETETGVARDSERAIIRREVELRLRHGGQQQHRNQRANLN